MNKTEQAWNHLKGLCFADPDYAWAVHCNIAMPIIDAIGVTSEQGNIASANVMRLLFDYDITTHRYFNGKKSPAQEYVELRMEAEREEDAA